MAKISLDSLSPADKQNVYANAIVKLKETNDPLFDEAREWYLQTYLGEQPQEVQDRNIAVEFESMSSPPRPTYAEHLEDKYDVWRVNKPGWAQSILPQDIIGESSGGAIGTQLLNTYGGTQYGAADSAWMEPKPNFYPSAPLPFQPYPEYDATMSQLAGAPSPLEAPMRQFVGTTGPEPIIDPTPFKSEWEQQYGKPGMLSGYEEGGGILPDRPREALEGLIRGGANLTGSALTYAEMLEKRLPEFMQDPRGVGGLERNNLELAEDIERWGEEQFSAQPRSRVSPARDPSVLGDPDWWIGNITETLPSTAVPMVAALKVARLKSLIERPKLARALALGTAGVIAGPLEGSQTYKQMLAMGESEEDAAKAALLSSAVIGALNTVGAMGWLRPQTKTRLSNALQGALSESVTEMLEEPAEDLIISHITGAVSYTHLTLPTKA